MNRIEPELYLQYYSKVSLLYFYNFNVYIEFVESSKIKLRHTQYKFSVISKFTVHFLRRAF